jgi:hypothetical protein
VRILTGMMCWWTVSCIEIDHWMSIGR